MSASAGVQSVVRKSVRGKELLSNRVRPLAEVEALASRRDAVALFELQGHLTFASAERAHRAMTAGLDGVEFLVIDFRRVTVADDAAIAILNRLAETLIDANCTVVALHERDNHIGVKMAPAIVTFVNTDAALEWCEDQLLGSSAVVASPDDPAPLSDFDLLEGLGAAELAAVEDALEIDVYEPGSILFREGRPGDSVGFLLTGRVGVLLPLDVIPRDRTRRIATFGPGTAFGEMALLDEPVRSADVVCDERSTVALLSLDKLHELDDAFPLLRPTLDANLTRLLALRLRAANTQIRALAR